MKTAVEYPNSFIENPTPIKWTVWKVVLWEVLSHFFFFITNSSRVGLVFLVIYFLALWGS